jgi:hypothetical protein
MSVESSYQIGVKSAYQDHNDYLTKLYAPPVLPKTSVEKRAERQQKADDRALWEAYVKGEHKKPGPFDDLLEGGNND